MFTFLEVVSLLLGMVFLTLRFFDAHSDKIQHWLDVHFWCKEG